MSRPYNPGGSRPHRAIAAALLSLVLVSGCGRLVPSGHQTLERSQLKAGTYKLDHNHARLLWKVDHLGFSTYVGRFDSFDASLDFDPDAPEQATLTVLVDTTSINTGNAAFDNVLRGPDWLDSAAFPEALFETTAIEVTSETSGRATGNLTLHGTTRPTTLDITFNGGADNFLTGQYTLGFAATATISRSAFGIDYLVPAIGDDITFEIHAEFLRN